MCNKNNVYFSLKTAVTALYCLKTTRAHVGESLLLLDSLSITTASPQGHGCCFSVPQCISQNNSPPYATHKLYVACQNVKNTI